MTRNNKIQAITASELANADFPQPKQLNFGTLMNCAIEVPEYVEDMRINFNNVEVIFQIQHGYVILLNSGFHFYVTEEQKNSIVKAMEAKRE